MTRAIPDLDSLLNKSGIGAVSALFRVVLLMCKIP
jgi:hypothetical protein